MQQFVQPKNKSETPSTPPKRSLQTASAPSVSATLTFFSSDRTDIGCNREEDSLVAPVTYARGSDEVVMQGIPLYQRNNVVPGFVQFRSLSFFGKPYALCAGVK